MFGLEGTSLILVIAILAVVLLAQWCVGYGVLRWTPLGGAFERWREHRPGWFVTWFTGMVIWMVAAALLRPFVNQ